MARGSMSTPNRLFSMMAAGMSAGSATEGFGGPAFLPGVLDLVEIHAVEEPEGVLPEVHGAAGRINQGDVAGALVRLDFGRSPWGVGSGSSRRCGGRGSRPPARERYCARRAAAAVPWPVATSRGASAARGARACCQPAPSTDPRRRVELVDDRELVGRARRALVLVAHALLLFSVEELVDPTQEVGRAAGVGGQVVVDQPDRLDEGGVGRPEAGAFVVGVEEHPDVAGDVAEGAGEGVPQPGRFRRRRRTCSVGRRQRGSRGDSGVALAGDGADHLGRLRERGRVAGRRQEEEPARLHGLEPHEPVEQRVGQLAQHVGEPAPGDPSAWTSRARSASIRRRIAFVSSGRRIAASGLCRPSACIPSRSSWAAKSSSRVLRTRGAHDRTASLWRSDGTCASAVT